MDPIISIIIPVFNVEKFLKRCFLSVENQTYKNIEVIIVNDGSNDNSLSIIEEYKRTTRFPTQLINQKNSGLSSARNNGYKISHGDYIFFLDSDDYIVSNLCEIAIENATYFNSEITEYGYYEGNREYFNAEFLGEKAKKIEVLSNRNAILNMTPMAWNKIFKKDLLVRAKLNFPNIYHEDEAEIRRLFAFADKIIRLDTKLYYYYRHADSITGNTVNQRTVDFLKVSDLLLKTAQQNPLYFLEFVYRSISLLYRCCKIWTGINESWANEALSIANDKINKLKYLEDDNPYFFIRREERKRYESSFSWRITKPMRIVSGQLKKYFKKYKTEA